MDNSWLERLGRGVGMGAWVFAIACGSEPASTGSTGGSGDGGESAAPGMLECGPSACAAGQVCVTTETCCNDVDYACTDIPESCEGHSGDALAACLCFDTPVGHDPATGVVTCQNFGCTTSCDDNDDGPIDTGGEPVTCGDDACAPGDLCVQTDTCCNVTDYACTPPGNCAGTSGVALAECMCFDTPVGYDDETSTVLCENFGCTTSCPGDSDPSDTDAVDDGNDSEEPTDSSSECGCIDQDECAEAPILGEPCVVDGECCSDVADFFLVCEAGVWVFDCTDGP